VICCMSLARYDVTVSDLLPNLDVLLDELSGSGPAIRDAWQLAEAVAVAASVEELDQELLAAIASWRKS
jgi:hypothetical protein